MRVEQNLICNHCSLCCTHCPYGNPMGDDYYPDCLDDGGERVIHIITGGEPLESKSLNSWIQALANAKSPFRIATAGFVPLRGWTNRLRSNPWFLGFNMGTDLLTSRCEGNEGLRTIWWNNWGLLSDFDGTWLTITLGDCLSLRDAEALVKKTRARVVLLNSEDLLPEGAFGRLGRECSEVTFVHGFNTFS